MPVPDWHVDNPPHPGPADGYHCMPTPERCHRSDPKRRPATDVGDPSEPGHRIAGRSGCAGVLPVRVRYRPVSAGPVVGGGPRGKVICSLYIDLVTREGREV